MDLLRQMEYPLIRNYKVLYVSCKNEVVVVFTILTYRPI